MSTWESVTTALSTLVALVAVLLAAWLILKWVGRRAPGQTGSRHIQVLDRVMVGQDKCLLLVRVASKVMLVAMTNGSTQKLCDVDETELDKVEMPEGQSFATLFSAMRGKIKNVGPAAPGADKEVDKWPK